MALSQEQEIQAAFNKASIAMTELEATIDKYYNTPSENIPSEQFVKIKFPSGYIRTRYYFAHRYNLNLIISNQRQRDSIAYSLMLSDLHNYFINRVQVWGIIKKLLLKGAIINLVSIIEAMLICSLGDLHVHCRVSQGVICKSQSKCSFYIKSSKNIKIAVAVEILERVLLLGDTSILQDIIDLNSIRNNVHLSILQRHEFINDDYSLLNYNKAIRVLTYLQANHSTIISAFLNARKAGCTGLIT
jgi:hypothetical protein